MRKLAIVAVAVAALSLAAKPAAADPSCIHHCSPVFDAMAYGLAAGLIGGYAYGTGTFIYRDLTQDTQSLEYGGVELGVNGALGALFGVAAVESMKSGSVGGGLVLGGLSAMHLTLAAHGGWRLYDRRGDVHLDRVDPDTVQRFAMLGYAVNTLAWASQLREHHGRGFGIAEAAVNAPIAAGLAYLAVDSYHRNKTGPTVLYSGMAAVSGALAVHGLYTVLVPWKSSRIEVLGADIAPTVVTDGREEAPGLGASGTW
jgi:hypothetical protein